MSGAPIRLLIVDDHPVVRDGLTGMFSSEADFEVVGEAANGLDAVRRAAGLDPDVILMDLRIPELDGVSAITRQAETGSGARVLVLTTYDNDTDARSAIEAGATGYLLKDAPQTELFRAVRAAARGEAVLSPSVATRVMGQFRTRPRVRSVSASSRCWSWSPAVRPTVTPRNGYSSARRRSRGTSARSPGGQIVPASSAICWKATSGLDGSSSPSSSR